MEDEQVRKADDPSVGSLWDAVHRLREEYVQKVAEITTTLYGVQGDNGVKGTLKELQLQIDVLQTRFDEAKDWANDLWYNQRPANCVGKIEAAKVQSSLEEAEKRIMSNFNQFVQASDELKKSRNAMILAIVVSLVSAVGGILAAILGK